MDFSIRMAETKDSKAICILNTEELGYNYPIDNTAINLSDIINDSKQCVYVAEFDNTVIGYIHATVYQLIYLPKLVNILGLSVAEEYHHRGVGSALLNAIEKWAHNIGAQGIRLNSGEERTDAHLFYKKCGYELSKKQFSFKKTL